MAGILYWKNGRISGGRKCEKWRRGLFDLSKDIAGCGDCRYSHASHGRAGDAGSDL